MHSLPCRSSYKDITGNVADGTGLYVLSKQRGSVSSYPVSFDQRSWRNTEVPSEQHENWLEDPVVVNASDATLTEHLARGKSLAIRPMVSAIDVLTDRPQTVIVALGDSITDGSVDPAPATGPGRLSGKRGNRRQPIAAVNAIYGHVCAVQVGSGRVLGSLEGADYYSEEKERVRKSVNDWIRTSTKFDEIIDFEAALRDPVHPGKLKADYDAGDHVHPNPAGYRKMGKVIDLHLFDF